MKNQSKKHAVVSFMFIFSILAAISLQWGGVGDFIANNQFSPENHFGLSDNGTVNHWALGPLIYTLALLYLVVVWKKQNLDIELQLIASLVVGMLVYYLLFHPSYDIVSFLKSVISSPPIVWGMFWMGVLYIFFTSKNMSDNTFVILILILFVVAGDIAHAWLGYWSIYSFLVLFSLALHLAIILAWIMWVVAFYILGVSLIIIMTTILAILLATLLLTTIVVILTAISIITLLLVSLLYGYTPKDVYNDTLERFCEMYD